MSVDYAAALWVGLPREQLEDAVFPVALGEEPDEGALRKALDDGDLEVCPPYYDGNSSKFAIVGLSLACTPRYTPQRFDLDAKVLTKIDQLKAKFKEITGLEGHLYLSPNGY